MIGAIKTLINALGIKAPVVRALRWYGRMFPQHEVIRRGVKYRLDLREVIDFATYFGGWEPETIDFIESHVKPGDVVIEVGANVGVQTLHLAKRVQPAGHVYAFEPTRFALAKLSQNLDLNPQLSSSVTVRRNLVTDHGLDVPQARIKSSYRIDPVNDLPTETFDKEHAISIDAFVESEGVSKLNLLKIDVDGYDFKVLKGARRTIASFAPEIYIELDEDMLNGQGDSVRDIFRFLSDLGYDGHFPNDQQVITDPEWLVSIVKRVGHINTVFSRTRAEMASRPNTSTL